ncbi:hypothetical protein [Rhodospirillaceae bacterium SYSU D60014]|uniref:hypothetical protein n=1 Tax=Virgifigura deserti TaxID=2268457 RepID=UPI000E673EA0
MSIHRYPMSSLMPDYARGILGIAIGAGGLILVASMSIVAFIFAGLTALFALFTIRTVLRQWTRVAVTEQSVSSRPGQERPLAWNEIEAITLRYYSTRRTRDRGWMTLKLKSGRRSIVVESSLNGFEAILARAAEAARRNRLALSETTRANFAMMGFPIDESSALEWGSAGGSADHSTGAGR